MGRPPAGEAPVYRPFAVLALASAVAGGIPLGVWMLGRLALAGRAAPVEAVLLHAHLQIFGFFGILILGVAHHLVARFVGRPVAPSRLTPVLLGLVAGGLALRLGGTALELPAALATAALLEAAAFLCFGAWLWRFLAPPALSLTRWHLAPATAWLVLALLIEAALRWQGGGGGPDPRGMRAAHTMAVLGGAGGWVQGVLLRAGPMFVPRWHPPAGLARIAPALLALGVLLAGAAEVCAWGTVRGVALARGGESLALATVAAVALSGGALGRAPRVVPLVSPRTPETWGFRLALLSAVVGAAGSAGAALLAWHGVLVAFLADALRHLVTVGFLTSMVVAMTFRLIPIFEGVALPWPALRRVAFWALLGGVVLRSAEVLAVLGAGRVLAGLPLSGVLVWVAVAAVLVNLLGAARSRRTGAAPPTSG